MRRNEGIDEIKELEAKLKRLKTEARIANNRKNLDAGLAFYCEKCSKYTLKTNPREDYPTFCKNCGNIAAKMKIDTDALMLEESD